MSYSVGKLIKFLRIAKGISQKNFAKKTGITSNYLSLIENEKRIPTQKYLSLASSVLGVSADLFTWQDIRLGGFRSKESKRIARRINADLRTVRNMIIHEMVSSANEA